MIGQLIAETDTGGIDMLMRILPWVTAFTVAVLGAIFAGIARVRGKADGKAEGKAEALQVGPQPFMVELKEQFITRREFDQLAAMVAVNTTEMKGLFRETMAAMAEQSRTLSKRIENQNDRLTKEIKDMGQGAYLGRQKIHNTVNAQGERLAKVEARVELADEIAEAIVGAVKEIH
jgi:hypothetical protein